MKGSGGAMPQDIRSSSDGRVFFVADMKADGVRLIDPRRLVEIGFVPTGKGTHGIYPNRDGRGFDGGMPEEHGGLRSMRERALLVDGALAVRESPRGGVEVRLEVAAAPIGEPVAVKS